ncbi:MAG: hypothetical protein MRJ65_02150 [Candidatus Brocadiaceae bacterium]|nr:hypothetical protein [Candidatus Brocadiaceae bacterium]
MKKHTIERLNVKEDMIGGCAEFMLTDDHQMVLNGHELPSIEAEQIFLYYLLGIGSIRAFIHSGDKKYLQDYEKAKSEMKDIYDRFKAQIRSGVFQCDKELLKAIRMCAESFFLENDPLSKIRNEKAEKYL